MITTPFSATVRQLDGAGIIDLTGEVNRDADGDFRSAYKEAAAGGASAILLNFSGVDYINSTGIAIIVSVLGEARRDGIAVRACGLSDHYKEIFEITHLSEFMNIFDDESSALEAMA